jgi:hypothetical protein
MRLRWFRLHVKQDICALAAAVGAEVDRAYAKGFRPMTYLFHLVGKRRSKGKWLIQWSAKWTD